MPEFGTVRQRTEVNDRNLAKFCTIGQGTAVDSRRLAHFRAVRQGAPAGPGMGGE